MRIIGLTGGIGSGKSTVAQFLRETGVPVIDADKTGHELLADNELIRRAVVEAFGTEITVNGEISRDKLAALIFSDESARYRLNGILHPAIIQQVTLRCAEEFQRGRSVVVVEAALIGEEEQREPWLSGLILVFTATEERVKRLVRDRNMKESEARERIASQTSPEKKIPLADWVLYNDGYLESLKNQAAALAKELIRLEEDVSGAGGKRDS